MTNQIDRNSPQFSAFVTHWNNVLNASVLCAGQHPAAIGGFKGEQVRLAIGSLLDIETDGLAGWASSKLLHEAIDQMRANSGAEATATVLEARWRRITRTMDATHEIERCALMEKAAAAAKACAELADALQGR